MHNIKLYIYGYTVLHNIKLYIYTWLYMYTQYQTTYGYTVV